MNRVVRVLLGLGTDGVMSYLQVLDHCSSAIVAAIR